MKDKFMLVYEVIMVLLAFTSVILIWSEDHEVLFLDKVIWLFFFIDVMTRALLEARTNYPT